MKTARLAVLGVALAAGLGAAYIMMGTKPPPAPAPIAAPAPVQQTDAVLVAAHDVGFGAVLVPEDVRWQAWPKDGVPGDAIARSRQPNGIDLVKGLRLQAGLSAGDLLHLDRLRKGPDSMSAVLPSGMRAVAIDLSDLGKTAAGGFVRPGDRVDVIRIYHQDGASGAVMSSETILTNIRVLAIGGIDQDKAGERTLIGVTATLELTPVQAEKAVLAQRSGPLTLSLRSMADSNAVDIEKPTEQPASMTIIRSGNASQTRVK